MMYLCGGSASVERGYIIQFNETNTTNQELDFQLEIYRFSAVTDLEESDHLKVDNCENEIRSV